MLNTLKEFSSRSLLDQTNSECSGRTIALLCRKMLYVHVLRVMCVQDIALFDSTL